MSKTDALENDILDLLFCGVAIADLADNDATSPATSLYMSLHTADPGEAGTQSTSEATYTSYARVARTRSSVGFTVLTNSCALAANCDFPAATGGTNTITHWGVGVAASGAGYLMYKGALASSIAVVSGVTPRINAGTIVTED
jgi:hypothetical protein